MGGDYGFAGSWAAAHLIVKLPADQHFKNGRFVVLDEYLQPNRTAKDYGQDLLDKWVLEGDRETGNLKIPDPCRAIQQWVVSPDAYRKDGIVNDQDVAFTRIDVMNAELGQWGFGFRMANNDRKSGWMRLYQMLRDGELIIAKHCVHTIEMLQTRLRDPKKLDDITKVAGDKLDDIADSLRYAIMTWDMNVVKPLQIRRQEAVQGLDPTNAYITPKRVDAEERQVGQAVSFTPKRRR